MPSPESPAGTSISPLRAVGVVAIGRNEGERLIRCFDTLPANVRHAVYVDSGSSDGSVEEARKRSIEVVELDMSILFTAARARNAGLRRLHERWPELPYVQVVDGDCVLVPGWLEVAVAEMESNGRLAMVCGRRRELHPGASIYNRLCDMEWDTPLGDADSCGGDALVRLKAVLEVGGYDERVIAGEEPELCARLRLRGWGIRRLDSEMTRHDAAMTRFGQWWRRAVRSGHGFGQVNDMHPCVHWRTKRSSLIWGALLPAAALLSAPITGGLGLALLLAYPLLWLRILAHRRARGAQRSDAALYASFCLLGKFPEVAGLATYWWSRGRGRQTGLIEYK